MFFKVSLVIINLSIFFSGLAQNCQSNMVSFDYEGFEYDTICPDAVPGTIYHLIPNDFDVRTGSRSLYLNFVNGLPPGTMAYERFYPVCSQHTYQLSVWLKAAWGGLCNITLNIVDEDASILDTWTGSIGGATWFNWSTDQIIPLTDRISFQLISNWAPGSNDLVMDDLELLECPLTVNLGNDTSICGGLLLLDATTPGGSYLWNDGSTNATLEVNSTGNYSVEVTVGSCSIIDDINVTIDNAFTVELGNDTSICGGSLLLDATTPGGSYLWSDGSTNATLEVNSTGNYSVEVTAGSCSITDEINVTIDNAITVDLGNDTSICGGLLLLDATTPGGIYLWNNGSTNATLEINSTGNYSVEVTVGSCSITDDINVTIDNAFTVDLGNDTSICGGSLLLDATTPGGIYLWNNGSTNATLEVNSTGNYSVEVAAGSCSITDEINVTIDNAFTVDLGNDTSICGGSLLLDATTPGGIYLWNDGSTNATLEVNSTGNYSVEVTVGSCSTTDDVNVLLLESLWLGDIEDTTICTNTAYQAIAETNASNTLWSTNEESSSILVYNAGTYWVYVSNGCSFAIDSFTVSTVLCDCPIYAPTAFTPNEDGVNDFFSVIGVCEFSTFELNIYNRWGERIYFTTDPNSYWNGTYKEKESEMDNYVWSVRYTPILNNEIGTEIVVSGDVLLLK